MGASISAVRGGASGSGTHASPGDGPVNEDGQQLAPDAGSEHGEEEHAGFVERMMQKVHWRRRGVCVH